MALGPEGRTWLYIAGGIAATALVIFLVYLGDSSAYTFHGEEINRKVFIPIFAGLAIAAFVWYKIANKKK